ncbi:MAG: hypothetical protein LKG27_06845 [Clostridiaceae bacterium]|nr:hypothetical protein [Clostridiaceae bacterium]
MEKSLLKTFIPFFTCSKNYIFKNQIVMPDNKNFTNKQTKTLKFDINVKPEDTTKNCADGLTFFSFSGFDTNLSRKGGV